MELAAQTRTKYFDRYNVRSFSRSGKPRVIEYPLNRYLYELPEAQRSDRAVLAHIARKQKSGTLLDRRGQFITDPVRAQIEADRLTGRLRGYYEDWLDEEFDWWLPNQYHSFRAQLFNRLQWFGEDAASKADRIWSVMS
jgi:hypothetical protein